MDQGPNILQKKNNNKRVLDPNQNFSGFMHIKPFMDINHI